MEYEYEIVGIEPITLAVTKATVDRANISSQINSMYDTIYNWLRDSDNNKDGPNYILYNLTDKGVQMLVGIPVTKPFKNRKLVHCIQLPHCNAARTTHIGDYKDLADTYSQLKEWCNQRSYKLGTYSWEVYKEVSNSKSKCITDVYIQLG